MKLLLKYLLLLLLLPMCGVGQQQVVLTKVHNIKRGISYSSEDNNKSINRYHPIDFSLPYYFIDSCASFYKTRKVYKIEVFDTLGKSNFALFLNRDGTLASSYCIDRGVAFKEIFEPPLYSRTSKILNTSAELNDSFVAKVFTYKNADTTLILHHNTTYTFKIGEEINARNALYNGIFRQKNNPDHQKNQTPYSLDYKMTRLLPVNYEPNKLYKCSEKRFCSWILTTKNQVISIDGIERLADFTHPFIQKLNFDKCINWFVEGENFEEPVNVDFEFEKFFWAHKMHCGNEDEHNYVARSRTEFTFEAYSQNEYGLNDTVFLLYYPMASKAELKNCLFFDGQDPTKLSEVSPRRDTEKMRSLIPQRTALFTIRYEYYKD